MFGRCLRGQKARQTLELAEHGGTHTGSLSSPAKAACCSRASSPWRSAVDDSTGAMSACAEVVQSVWTERSSDRGRFRQFP